MPLFRLGDHGSAVAEIRSILAGRGLLSAPSSQPTGLTNGTRSADGWTAPEDIFDAETDHAVRAFQQERGLIVDGIVGPATYRALREASYKLGTRVLAFRFSAPMVGDDVATLQSRLQNLGYYTSLVDGVFGAVSYTHLTLPTSELG